MIFSVTFITIIVSLISNVSGSDSSFYQDYLSEPTVIQNPAFGSLVGDYNDMNQSHDSLYKGRFSLPLPVNLPQKRGSILHNFLPSYSIANGISSWGLGWSSPISVRRVNLHGEITYTNNDFLQTPLGMLKYGEDGYWYLLGEPNKVVGNFENEKVLHLYTQGVKFSFGSEAIIEGPKGVYSWFLNSVQTSKGDHEIYTYQFHENEAPLLTSVSYALYKKRYQYKVDLIHTSLQNGFVNFHSGKKVVSTSILSSINISALDNQQDTYKAIYKYNIDFIRTPNGVGHFLKSIQKVYPSGEIDPRVVYDYYHQDLNQLQLVKNERWNELLEIKSSESFSFSTSSFIDLEKNGELDIEGGNDYTLYSIKNGELVKKILEPYNENVQSSCRRTGVAARIPRNIIHMNGPKKEPVVVSFQRDVGMILCDRDGKLLKSIDLGTKWNIDQNVKIVDINKDNFPDLIKISENIISIKVNQPDNDGLANFDTQIDTYITGNTRDLSFSFRDINGDHLLDLVGNAGSHFLIWYGMGHFTFTPQPERFNAYFSYPNDQNTELLTQNSTFIDFNKDGASDLIIWSDHEFKLYANKGPYFERLDIPVLENINSRTSTILVLDLLNTGNTQINVINGMNIDTLELFSEKTALLKKVDNGKGIEIGFQYKRIAPSPGIGTRKVVLSSSLKNIAGEGITDTHYDYNAISLHEIDRQFMGFHQVNQISNDTTTKYTFNFMNDTYKGYPASIIESSSKIQDLSKYQETSYLQKNINGLPWIQLQNETSGFMSNLKKTIDQQTHYEYEDLCLQKKTAITNDSQLTTIFTKTKDFDWGLSQHCKPSQIEILGNHRNDSDLDFHYLLNLTYNQSGLMRKISLGDVDLQKLTYDNSCKLSQYYSPNAGIGSYQFDSTGKIKSFDSSFKKELDYTNGTDLLVKLTDQRGDSVSSQNGFSYDRRNFLQSKWNTITNTTKESPLESYQYQFGSHSIPGIFSKTSFITNTERITTKKLTSANGTILANIHETNLGTIQKSKTLINRADQTTLNYPNVDSSLNIQDQIDYSNLYDRSIDPVISTEKSFLGMLSQTKTYQEATQGYIEKFYSNSTSGLSIQSTENEDPNLTERKKIANNKIVQYEDQSGAIYNYSYDALNRLRKIIFPNNQFVTINYNQIGMKSSIIRSNLLKKNYFYEQHTGLLSKSETSNSNNEIKRKTEYRYDNNGRIILKTNTSDTHHQNYRYYYNGKNPSNTIPGQQGFLTRIEGPDFQKTFEYLPDGKLKKEHITILKNHIINIDHNYRRLGEEESTKISYNNLTTNQSWEYTIYRTYDYLNRLDSIKWKDDTLHTAFSTKYNKLNQIESLSFPSNNSTLIYVYDKITNNLKGKQHIKNNQTALNYTWGINNRGNIDIEEYLFNGVESIKNYSYDSRKFLTKSSDNLHSYQFEYDPTGVLKTQNIDDDQEIFNFNSNNWTVNSETYKLNDLGEVIYKDNRKFEYSASGRIRKVYIDDILSSENFIDEENQIFFRKDLSNDEVTINFPWGLINSNSGPIYLVKDSNSTVGSIGHFGFKKINTDIRNSYIHRDNEDSLQYRSPYGNQHYRNDIYDQLVAYADSGYDSFVDGVLMGHRFYDPKAKRFLTPDNYFLENPEKCIDSPVECNLYSYAKNNPISYVDPTGQYSEYLQAVINESFGRNEPQRAMNAITDAGKATAALAGGALAVGAAASLAPVVAPVLAQKAVGLALTATIKTNTALVGAGMFVARNPQQVEKLVGATASFAQGFVDGLTKANAPAADGNYSPGSPVINGISGEAGKRTGEFIRDNYVEK
ncbi:hypothetical protein OAB57_00515 [Bacteriovoracaceae bacterium]|nr:hypothetical protein [Bacteriovoracaceae bacterium]